MANQPTPPTPSDSPERRAAVIAGIRALADLLVTHPDLPTPQSVYAQYSVIGGSDDDKIAAVRAAAETLGVEPDIDDGSATTRKSVARGGHLTGVSYFDVRYVVHSNLTGGEQA